MQIGASWACNDCCAFSGSKQTGSYCPYCSPQKKPTDFLAIPSYDYGYLWWEGENRENQCFFTLRWNAWWKHWTIIEVLKNPDSSTSEDRNHITVPRHVIVMYSSRHSCWNVCTHCKCLSTVILPELPLRPQERNQFNASCLSPSPWQGSRLKPFSPLRYLFPNSQQTLTEHWDRSLQRDTWSSNSRRAGVHSSAQPRLSGDMI